ncbi:MAG TPA: alpha-amylase, partial [Gammaproteobacteria bacterium]|nr:alpha-amylase [Gammaproteobacteria bacterium]
VHAEIDATLGLLNEHLDDVLEAEIDAPAEPEEARARLRRLETLLHERVVALTAQKVEALATRVHGDYHLGQALISGADFIIVDLEGEPGRSFDERRRKTTALKDVAGMLRSFDYARSTALRTLVTERLADTAQIQALLDHWRDETQAMFLSAYGEAMQGCGVYPQNPGIAARLIDLAKIEKLLYEIRYELRNRPDWLAVPWRDLSALLA